MQLRRQREKEIPVSIPTDSEFQLIIRGVKTKSVLDDSYFDRIFPEWVKERSRMHWTPIQVAYRAVEHFLAGRDTEEEARILDVGSGVGKFCLIGALCSNARFFGVEQRPHFVELSRRIMDHYRIPRVTFMQMNLTELDWNRFNCVYLFNPFQENKTPAEKIDGTVPLSRTLYSEYIHFTQARLRLMPQGTRVVTYHGFGGTFPPGYHRQVREFCVRGPMELWVRETS